MMAEPATVVKSEVKEHMTWTPIKMSQEAKAKLSGVEVLGGMFSLNSRGIGDIDRDFMDDWKNLHGCWSGKAKEEVRSDPVIGAYCRFYESLGLKPKETPPSIMNIIQRFLLGATLDRTPKINTIVDAVNVAAVKDMVPLGVFDAACVSGELVLDVAKGGESYVPLGSSSPMEIKAGTVILRDDEKVLSQFCYRDSDAQKVTGDTSTIWLLGCQVPGVSREAIVTALNTAKTLLERDYYLN